MHQKIGYEKDRIVFFFTDIDNDLFSVFLDNNAMYGKRDRHPLIFFDTAVIMGIQECEITILV